MNPTELLLQGLDKIKLYAGGIMFAIGIITLISPIAVMSLFVLGGAALMASYYMDQRKVKKEKPDEQLELELNGGKA